MQLCRLGQRRLSSTHVFSLVADSLDRKPVTVKCPNCEHEPLSPQSNHATSRKDGNEFIELPPAFSLSQRERDKG